jgi:hypothetical protein
LLTTVFLVQQQPLVDLGADEDVVSCVSGSVNRTGESPACSTARFSSGVNVSMGLLILIKPEEEASRDATDRLARRNDCDRLVNEGETVS